MSNFWNERFGTEEYAYGKAPNKFVKQELSKLRPGKILFPAEGEGRNAVFAAELGWNVSAFDPSVEGKKKALTLAQNKGVHINYLIGGYETVHFPENSFDCLVLVFAHMPPDKRQKYHRKLLSFLKPEGKLILEGFSKKQIGMDTGGPKNIDMLFSESELQSDFQTLTELNITEIETHLNEGSYHKGKAWVIRASGMKAA